MKKQVTNVSEWVKGCKAQIEEIKKVIEESVQVARIACVAKATELTPPTNDGKLRGKNTITGKMKSSWEKDSTEVAKTNTGWEFTLSNNRYYASYVNDGHDLKKHYVPGLHIDEELGILYFDEEEPGGIYVGTKTQRIEPLHITEQAEEEFNKVLKSEIERRIKELE